MNQNLIIGLILGRFGSLEFMNFLKLQLCADQNVNILGCTKGAFFQIEVCFQSPKKIFQKTVLSLKFENPAHISKQIIQISSSE